MIGVLVASVIAIAGAACGGSNDGDGPPPLATAAPKDAGTRDSGILVPAEAGPMEPGAATFKGKLGKTNAVKFGGTPYCEYTMTLEDIEVEIAALPSGEVIGAAVKDRAVETAVPPCPHAPMKPSAQRFALTTVTPAASGSKLAFEGAAGNRPATSLVVDLTRVGVTYEATATWTRTDQGPPLSWTVKATLTLTEQ
ncbi:MAG: hypothetical protein BGO98_23710 [Myxococcales bacterium 68-20]|nr:MAG: hypothetical protein BGO98_23710 [Myxococcales bacterium 68-20]